MQPTMSQNRENKYKFGSMYVIENKMAGSLLGSKSITGLWKITKHCRNWRVTCRGGGKKVSSTVDGTAN